jgi:hypothetical protein
LRFFTSEYTTVLPVDSYTRMKCCCIRKGQSVEVHLNPRMRLEDDLDREKNGESYHTNGTIAL